MWQRDDLRAQFLGLAEADRRRVLLWLGERALAVWEEFAAGQAPLTYFDSVVGMGHEVEIDLPRAALAAARAAQPRPDLSYRYREPIVALQDGDLTLGDPAELCFYAIYNLFRRFSEGAPVDDWLIVQQALAAAPPGRGAGLLAVALAPAN